MSTDVPIDLRRARRDPAKRGIRVTAVRLGPDSTDAADEDVLRRLALWLADVAAEAVPTASVGETDRRPPAVPH